MHRFVTWNFVILTLQHYCYWCVTKTTGPQFSFSVQSTLLIFFLSGCSLPKVKKNSWEFSFVHNFDVTILIFILLLYSTCNVWRCAQSMPSRVYETIGRPSVCLSVRLSVPSLASRTRLVRVCCCAPGGQEIPIDCCTALSSSCAAARRTAANAGSVTLSADVGSWTRTDLFCCADEQQMPCLLVVFLLIDRESGFCRLMNFTEF